MYFKFKVLSEGYGERFGFKFAERAFVDASNYFYEEQREFRNKLHDKIKLNAVVLSKDSSLVDFIFGDIEFGGMGIFVSEKALGEFIKYSLPTYRFFPVDVILHGEKSSTNFFWIQFINYDMTNFIDFMGSNIIIKESDEKVENLDQFRVVTYFKTKKELSINKLVFKPDFPNFDFFEISGLGYFQLITKRFKENCIEKNILTGLHPMDNIFS